MAQRSIGQDPSVFTGPRQSATFLGPVPRQNSSGGKIRLGRISKMGNSYIRDGTPRPWLAHKASDEGLPRPNRSLRIRPSCCNRSSMARSKLSRDIGRELLI